MPQSPVPPVPPVPPDLPDLPAPAPELLHLWFEDGLQRDWPTRSLAALWFGTDAGQDARLRERFGTTVQAALDSQLEHWAATPLGRLALVLLLDQLPRNLFRGQAAAFAGDAAAQAHAEQALASGQDRDLPTVARVFFYIPFMHAESLAQQERGVDLFEALIAQAPAARREALEGHLRYARLHRDIVARFGRFPHRNAALGRASTEEELAFLRDGPRFGQ